MAKSKNNSSEFRISSSVTILTGPCAKRTGIIQAFAPKMDYVSKTETPGALILLDSTYSIRYELLTNLKTNTKRD